MPRKSMTKKKRPATIECRTPFSCGSDIANWEYLYPQKAAASPSQRTLPDDAFNPDKVKQWINTQKELAILERKGIRQKVKGAIANHASHEAYVKNLQRYLRTGDWVDDFYGEYQEKRIRWRCRVPAYFWTGPNAGKIKRSIGVYYDDIADVWTKEMFEEDGYVLDAPAERKTVKKRRKRRKTNK